MITDIQKKWLSKILNGELTKADNPRKYSAYMRRIQDHIDHMVKNLIWLAETAPDLLKYEEREYDNPSSERHIRLKNLLGVCVKISPYSEDPTIFKILGQFIPNYGIELVRKPAVVPKPLVVLRCDRCKGTFEEKDYKEKGNKCPHCGYEKVSDY